VEETNHADDLLKKVKHYYSHGNPEDQISICIQPEPGLMKQKNSQNLQFIRMTETDAECVCQKKT